MAYNPQDPNKLKDESPEGGAGAPQQLSSASSVIGPSGGAGAPGSSAQSSPQNKAPSASGYTNAQKYVGANQEQGGALGQTIGGKIQGSIDTASNLAGSASAGYRDQVNPDQYKFDAKSFDPLKVDQKQFSNLFQGPKTGLYDDSTARQEVGKAQSYAQKIATNPGRDQLVGEEQTLTKSSEGVGAGKNTAGLRYFDRLLLQGSEGGKDAIEQTASRLEGAQLDSKLAAEAGKAQAIDQEAIDRQAAAAEAARGAVGSQATALQNQIAQQTAQQKAALEANQKRVFDALSNRQDLNSQDLQSFGLNKDQYGQVRQAFDERQKQILQNEIDNSFSPRNDMDIAQMWERRRALEAVLESGDFSGAKDLGVDLNFDIAPYLKKNDLSEFGAQNTVSSEQLARARALEGLAQISGNQLGSIAPQAASQFNSNFGSVDFQSLLNSMQVQALPKQQVAEIRSGFSW